MRLWVGDAPAESPKLPKLPFPLGLRAVDLVSRFGDSHGFDAVEPKRWPKRLTLIFNFRLNQQPARPVRDEPGGS